MFVKAQLGSLLKCHVIVIICMCTRLGKKQLYGGSIRVKATDEHPRIFNYPANLREM